MMNTHQIIQLLANDRVTRERFRGVFPSNKIPETVFRRPYCVIFNTAPAPVSGHWVALYVDLDGKGYYLDSYGYTPRKIFTRFFKKNCSEIMYNQRRLQGFLTTTCGYYCIVFLIWMCRGGSMAKFLKQFTDNLMLNDHSVTHSINRLYNASFRIVDSSFYSSLL